MDSASLLIALRLIHIITAAAWFGSALMLVLFLTPMVQREGVEGSRLIQRMVRAGLTKWMAILSGVGVLAGFALYARNAAYSGAGWSQTRVGMTLGIGGVLGLAAAIIGVAVVGRAAKKIADLGDTLGSPETETTRIQAQDRLSRAGMLAVVLIVLSTAAMAVARYV